MEFFKIINVRTTADQIQKIINFDNLDNLCESIFIMDYNDNIVNLPYGYRVREDEQIVSLLINTGFLSDNILPEIFAMYDVSYESYWIRPKLGIRYETFWQFEVGANFFEGEGDDTQHAPFAVMDKGDSAYVQIRRMF